MKINGSYTFATQDLPRVFRTLQDPEVLARCLPGCEALEKTGEDEYAVKLKMAIAAFSGLFTGKVRLADANPHTSFRLIVEGSGQIGFMKGEGLLRLAAAAGDAGTAVTYEGEAQVGGTIAAVGQRLVETTSKIMIKRFFDKIAAELK